MRNLRLLCPLCACAVLAWADTVEMKPEGADQEAPGLKLEGKVVREVGAAIVFAVYNETGQVLIPRSKIKSIDYDVDTQLKDLAEDDYPGRYRVGKWAIEHQKYKEAIKLFEDLKGKEGVGQDMLKLLAYAYEQRQQLDKAFENYNDYLKLNPDDAEVAAKVEKLKKEVNPEPEVAQDTKTAVGKAKVEEGLEANGVWVRENWGHPGSVDVVPDETGRKVVAMQSLGGPDPDNQKKFAVSRTGQPLNLSDSKEMLFKVLCKSDAPVSLAIAFVNAQGDFHEMAPKKVAPNSWVNFSQKIEGKIYKSNRNDFKGFNLGLEGSESIKRILFLVYSSKPFTMYLESIYFK